VTAWLVGAIVALSVGLSAQSGRRKNVQVQLLQPSLVQSGITTEITDLEPKSPSANPRFLVFDNSGRILNEWSDPLPNWAFAELVKPLSAGHILAMIYDRQKVNNRPKEKMLVELDWNGNVVWQFDPRPMQRHLHHDFQRLANGNTVVITQQTVTAPAINANPIFDEVLMEVDPNGRVVWEWSTEQHAGQLGLPKESWQYLATFPGSTPKAVFHMNSVQSLPPNRWEKLDRRFRAGNLLVSLRETNLLFLIDRRTGNVVWDFQGAIGQHHARMLPESFPNAGNITLFDNGGISVVPFATRYYSKVLEIDPMTKQVIWSYQCRTPVAGGCAAKFFTNTMGCAQRLRNGNTLITESITGNVFEITPAGQIVWQHSLETGTKIYRAYRWETVWPTSAIEPFIW